MKVLLLDGDTVQALSVLKSLKRSNASVTIFCEHRISFGYASRYSDLKVIAPPIKGNEPDFFDFISTFLKNNPHDLIIPLYNDSAEFLSSYKSEFDLLGIKTAIPEFENFIKAHDKEQLMEICKQNGISHPRTANPAKSSLAEAAEYVKFPMLIKPNLLSGARGIIYINNREELTNLYESAVKNYGECTLQEYINHTGIYYNAMLYRTKNGAFTESVVIKIIRYFPIKGGTSSYCVSVDYPEIVEECKKLLNVLDWHGFADVDLIEDKDTHEMKIIEINPRIPASIKAAEISGINYPQVILSDMMGQELPDFRFVPGMILRFFALDMMWFIFSKDRFSTKPSWFDFWNGKLYYQDGSFSDPLPMLSGILAGLTKYLNPKFRKSKFEKV